MLPLGLTDEALAAAAAEPDPESLAASVRLRERFGPELAAAAVTQVMLRRRARVKFGPTAETMFFTRDGLEQATRPEVAAHHASRLVAAGAQRVVDLGCGIGTDALAFLSAGLPVVAVERDPATAAVARANLATATGPATVQVGAAEECWPALATPGTAVFCDPARRTSRGRSWRVEDLSPDWTFVADLLGPARPALVKLGPGLAHRLIPPGVEAEWVSHHGDTVELTLSSGPGSVPGRRSAYVVDSGNRLVADPGARATTPRAVPVGGVVYEPLGAVVRAGALGALAARLDAAPLAADSVYLTGAQPVATPYATAFVVRDSFGYREQDLRAWVRTQRIGRLEILTRGMDLDPAVLRKRLRPAGPNAATLIVTRTVRGKEVLVVDRYGSRI